MTAATLLRSLATHAAASATQHGNTVCVLVRSELGGAYVRTNGRTDGRTGGLGRQAAVAGGWGKGTNTNNLPGNIRVGMQEAGNTDMRHALVMDDGERTHDDRQMLVYGVCMCVCVCVGGLTWTGWGVERRRRGHAHGVHCCCRCRRFGSVKIGLLLSFTNILLIPDTLVTKPV